MTITLSLSTGSENPIKDYIDDDDKIVNRYVIKRVTVYPPNNKSPYKISTTYQVKEPLVIFKTSKGRLIKAEPVPVTSGAYMVNFYEIVKSKNWLGKLLGLSKDVPIGSRVSYITFKK